MVDKNDFVVRKESDGKNRRIYRCFCDICGMDQGYHREKESRLCRRCSSIKAKSKRLKKYRVEFKNVDFNDYIDKPYNKVKSKGSGLKRLYRCLCQFCSNDKGYVRYTQFKTRCFKCVMTEKRRQNISIVCRNEEVKKFDGFKSPENSRIRQSEEGRKWSKEILAKANFTCFICNAVGESLHAHHVKPFSVYKELRFDKDNGKCLCKKCHTEFHSKYGNKNNNLKQLLKFKKSH